MRLGLWWPAILLLAAPAALFGQEPAASPERFRESVAVQTERAAIRQLDAVRLLLAESDWERAADRLVQIAERYGQSLIDVEPGRYLNVDTCCHLVAVQLGREALAAYRKRIDPRFRDWFERGRRHRDEALLRRVIDEGFASSYGDDALLLLGEWCWERGDITAARRYWEQLIPLPESLGPEAANFALRYPDSDFGRAEILARLVLTSVTERDLPRARLELEAFRRMHPTAAGELAGRRGPLAEILSDVLSDAEQWRFSAEAATVATFAINTRRNAVLPRPIDVGSRKWVVPLRTEQDTSQNGLAEDFKRPPLSYFPVVHGNVVLVNDAFRIWALDLETGKPAWPAGGDDSGVVYPAVAESEILFTTRTPVGVPRYTMTVRDGRLYARMGTPITGWAQSELRKQPSDLVCLDLEHDQGKLVWKIPLNERGADWAFEGSPVVDRGRVYVTLRRGQPQTELNVACYDAYTGSAVWNRKVCAAVTTHGEETNLVGHQLLTLADRTLFYSTDLGGVAAIDADDGSLRWVVTYESQRLRRGSDLNDERRHGLTPCLFHDGLVVAAPNDYAGLMGIDAQLGLVRWKQQLDGGVRHLLGVAERMLIVSGDRLWGLDVDSGNPQWRLGFSDPPSFGYGRGLLVGDWVYWPTSDELLIIEQQTGTVVRRVALAALHGETGGNLCLADGHLLIAGPTHLAAFDEFSRLKNPRETFKPSSSRPSVSTNPFSRLGMPGR